MSSLVPTSDQGRFIAWLQSDSSRDIFATLSSATTMDWSHDLLKAYEDRWDWQLISTNHSIIWTKDMVVEFQNKLYWFEESAFLKNQTLLDDEQIFSLLINRYWYHFESSTWMYDNLAWNTKRIAHYFEKIDWHLCSLSPRFLARHDIFETYINLFTNSDLAWPLNESDTFNFIERNLYSLDWSRLSSFTHIPWSKTLIAHFDAHWDYDVLFENAGLPWQNESIFALYHDRVHPLNLLETKAIITENQFETILNASNLEPTDLMFDAEDYEDLGTRDKNNGKSDADLIIWKHLSRLRLLDWNTALILKYKDSWDWEQLCLNPSIKWHELDFTLFLEQLNLCCMLQSQPNQIWDDKVLLPLLDQFPWQSHAFYSHIAWTVEIIELFESKIDWPLLSRHGILANDVILKFKDKLHWKYLSFNHKSITDQRTYLNFYDLWPIQILSNPNIVFEEKDILKFADSFEQFATQEIHYQVFVGSMNRNSRFGLSIPSMPWTKSVLQVAYKALDGKSLAQDHRIVWTIDNLELISNKPDFNGCDFRLMNLDFINTAFLNQFK